MVHFDKTWFGTVMIDGKTHKDVLVIGSNIIDRENMKPGWFDSNSHHSVYDHELSKLLEGKPEAIIIGDGYSNVLEVPIRVANEIKQRKIELIVLDTPKAIEEYNKLSKSKRVNALIHSTC
jgi:hypothetical protein